MAYLRQITQLCKRCGKKATTELVNCVNTGLGFYCSSCGRLELKRQLVEESKLIRR